MANGLTEEGFQEICGKWYLKMFIWEAGIQAQWVKPSLAMSAFSIGVQIGVHWLCFQARFLPVHLEAAGDGLSTWVPVTWMEFKAPSCFRHWGGGE